MNKKNKLVKYILILLLIMMVLNIILLCSCEEGPTKNNPAVGENFVVISKDYIIVGGCRHTFYTIVDKESKVMYLYAYQGGITPLYNKDGSLKTYKGVMPQ